MIQVFDKAFDLMKHRGWDKIAVAVDLHGTVFEPTYSTQLSTGFYAKAKETLQLMSKNPNIMMYMYTCSPQEAKAFYLEYFMSCDIAMTPWRLVQISMGLENNEFQNFDKKPYFNVLLDDKAGFDPSRDWVELLNYFKEKNK